MTERERLIELLKGAEGKVTEMLSRPLALEEWLGVYADHLLANGVMLVDTDAAFLVTNREPIRTALGMPLDELAELIRAKQEGRIIVPPCKVGDTVYRPRIELCEGCSVEAFVITHIITDETLDGVHRRYRGDGVCPILFTSEKLGKTVFLTKEEAEKALAERSRGCLV